MRLFKNFYIDKNILIILGCSFLLMSFTLFNRISWGHDYIFHVSNIFGMDVMLEPSNGKFLISKIVPIVGYNFGYGVGIFYPPLAHVITTYSHMFLKYFHFNLPLTMELIKLLVIFLSGISMYFLVKRVSKSDQVSLLSSLSYIATPYFLTDIYVRCAFSEIFIFIFMPIVLRGIYELFYGKRQLFYFYFVTGYVGLMLSHLVLACYFTFIILIILLFKVKEIMTDKKYKELITASIIILCMTSFFYVPMIEHKLINKYVVFQDSAMSSDKSMLLNQLSFGDFFSLKNYSNLSGFKVGMNLMVLLLVILAVFDKKIWEKKEYKEIRFVMLLLTLISMILSSKLVPWQCLPDVFNMIQFPWRFISFLSLGLSFIAGFALLTIPKGQKKLAVILFSSLIIFIGMNSIYTGAIIYPNLPTDMYEVGMGAQHEYLPVNAAKNEKYLKTRDHKIHVLEGKAKTTMKQDKVPNLKAKVQVESKTVTLELPRLYYLGYQITLTKHDGSKERLEYYENKKGFIEVEVSESGALDVQYHGTIAGRIGTLLSFVTFIIFYGWILVKKKYQV